jgi:hypothetical protein
VLPCLCRRRDRRISKFIVRQRVSLAHQQFAKVLKYLRDRIAHQMHDIAV